MLLNADVHNHVFGQLGTIALTMTGLGMSLQEVEAAVRVLCKSAQLAEDLEIQLMCSIRYLVLYESGPMPSTLYTICVKCVKCQCFIFLWCGVCVVCVWYA